jgi:excisionase family DNA binding protein
MLEKLLNKREMADLLNVSIHSVNRLIAQKKLPVVRVGRRVLGRPSTLDSWIREKEGK